MKSKFISVLLLVLSPGLLLATPEEAQALVEQAKAAQAADDLKKAVSLYEDAIKADPDNAQLQTDYAQVLAVRIGQVNFMAQGFIAQKMLKAYNRSVEIDPNHITGWIGLCRYYLNAPPIAGGSANKAETYAKEVHARLAWLGEVELALVEEKRGELAKSAEHFRAALAAQPQHGEAVAGLKRVEAKMAKAE